MAIIKISGISSNKKYLLLFLLLPFSFSFILPSSSSSVDMPKLSLSFFMIATSGSDCPLSHLDTAFPDTPKRLPNSSWVKFFLFLVF